MEAKMRNIAVIAGIVMMGTAMGAELPICEEFTGEESVHCVRGDDFAVVTTKSPEGTTYEFYQGSRKAYVEVGNDGSMFASSGIRKIDVAMIPAEDRGGYVWEVVKAVTADIGF